jgi:hypothetical protein
MMIAHHIEAVRGRIAAAARRAGRQPDAITLVAVTKTHPPQVVQQAIAAGVIHLGENRVQEAQEKIAALQAERARVRWHLLGHLQRNKAKAALSLFDSIQTLDSLRLAETLNHQAQQATPAQPFPVLLQVNVSGEASKEGFALPGGLENHERLSGFMAQVAEVLALPHLQVRGLMTIAPYSDDPQTARPVFRRLRLLRDDLARRFPAADWSQLSMGMSSDFEVAIEEGATIVRIGRALFGERV